MNNEEQLKFCNNANLDAVEHNKEVDNKTNNENLKENEFNTSILPGKDYKTGSSSKFKSVDALFRAYENLEKEFTKKCQALSNLTKDNNEEKLPVYCKENWQAEVQSFLSEHPNAKCFTNEIADVLIKDENLSKKDDALKIAYSIVLDKNYKTKEELLNDSSFVSDFILKNEKIKNLIIEEYLNEISSNKTIPLISNAGGTQSVSSPKYIPKSLKEAGLYAEHILKK